MQCPILDAQNTTCLKSFKTQAPFPLSGVPGEMKVYLQETVPVQTSNTEIRQLAIQLTKDFITPFDKKFFNKIGAAH
jgi:hypothetical protein